MSQGHPRNQPDCSLCILAAFEGYLRSRGLVVKKRVRIDNAAIREVGRYLDQPYYDENTTTLLNAVFSNVEEMATPSAADLLLNASQRAGMPFDEEVSTPLADIVMQVWLFDSKMVEAQHAWHTWKTPRRMECFQPANLTGKAPINITGRSMAKQYKDAGDWFAKHNRGASC